MKTLTLSTGLALIATLAASNLDAQQNTTKHQNSNRQIQDATQSPRNSSQQRTGRRAPTSIVRASKVIGMEVKNGAEEALGRIMDLAIDSETGEIAYAAVSMGGLLGVGDKLFAVPWDAIEYRSEEGVNTRSAEKQQRADKVAVLDIDKKTFEQAQGFDQNNWPDMANPSWQRENDRLYEAIRRKADQKNRNGATEN